MRAALIAPLLCVACAVAPGPLGDLVGNWQTQCGSREGNAARQTFAIDGTTLLFSEQVYVSTQSCSGEVAYTIEVEMAATVSGDSASTTKNIDLVYGDTVVTPGSESIATNLAGACGPLVTFKKDEASVISGKNCGTVFGQIKASGATSYNIYSITGVDDAKTLVMGDTNADATKDGSTAATRPVVLSVTPFYRF